MRSNEFMADHPTNTSPDKVQKTANLTGLGNLRSRWKTANSNEMMFVSTYLLKDYEYNELTHENRQF